MVLCCCETGRFRNTLNFWPKRGILGVALPKR
jgi:hypothetical protein